jgi:mRNA-degrading endonuclease RelE of RelBE toxin-antitoxin system
MTRWHIEIGEEAEKELAELDSAVYLRVLEKLEWLAKNFSRTSPQLLRYDRIGEFKIRIGDYRILYRQINPSTLFVVQVGHRSVVYKKKKKA